MSKKPYKSENAYFDTESRRNPNPDNSKRIFYTPSYIPLFICPPIKFTRWDKIKNWFRIHVLRKPHRFKEYKKRTINEDYYMHGILDNES